MTEYRRILLEGAPVQVVRHGDELVAHERLDAAATPAHLDDALDGVGDGQPGHGGVVAGEHGLQQPVDHVVGDPGRGAGAGVVTDVKPGAKV